VATDLTPDELRIEPAVRVRADGVVAARTGFAAALIAATLTVIFIVLSLAFPGGEWAGIEAYADDFRTVEVGQLLPVLVLAPVVVILMASIHALSPARQRLFSQVAVVFAAIYAAIIGTNYVLQLVVVRHNIIAGELDGLTLLAMPNPRSVFVALEIVGYGFFALMALAAGGAFTGTGRERWVQWLLAVTGVTGLVGAAGGLAGQRIVMLAGFGLSLMAFLVATFFLVVHFRRSGEPTPASAVASGGPQP
jgi:hypothetical protein